MAHTNVFLRTWSGDRVVTAGGRGSSDCVKAWLNTANRNGEAGMTVTAEVVGLGLRPRERRKKDIGDDRESVFTIELPEPDEAVRVEIVEHGHKMKQLAAFGATLCLVRGMVEAEENPEYSAKCRKFGIETLAELEAEVGKNVPRMILPGGATLSHALACVQIVRQMREEGGARTDTRVDVNADRDRYAGENQWWCPDLAAYGLDPAGIGTRIVNLPAKPAVAVLSDKSILSPT